jgi:hypothetical protein
VETRCGGRVFCPAWFQDTGDVGNRSRNISYLVRPIFCCPNVISVHHRLFWRQSRVELICFFWKVEMDGIEP